MSDIKHILFPFDFSSQGTQTARIVQAFAAKLDAKVTIFSVVPPTFDVASVGMGARIGDSSAEWTNSLQARLNHALVHEFAGVRTERVADGGDPSFRITDYAHRHKVDLVMMPTHGLGTYRTLLVGSVTSKVLHDAECPVWTAAHSPDQQAGELPKTVVCALDGTKSNVALLHWARDFCARVGASLKLLHVVRPITDWPELESERQLQEQFRKEAATSVEKIRATAGVDAPLRVVVGEVVATVTKGAQMDGADLLVIGRGLMTASMGRLRTHAYGIIQASNCPVISV